MNIAPAPAISDMASAAPGLRFKSVWVMVLLFIFSLHTYAFYWYVDTTRTLNNRATEKISGGFMALCIAIAVGSASLVVTRTFMDAANMPAWLPTVVLLVKFTDSALWLSWTLRLRNRFNQQSDVARRPECAIPLLWACLFQMFYVQFKINELVDSRLIRGRS
jgi:hypothetical protein